EGNGEHADAKGNARSVDDAGEDISSVRVGPEQVVAAKALKTVPGALGKRIIRRDERREDRDQHDQEDQDRPEQGRLVALERSPGALALGDDLGPDRFLVLAGRVDCWLHSCHQLYLTRGSTQV